MIQNYSTQELLDLVLHQLPTLIYINDANALKNVFTSDYAEDVLGYTAKEISDMGNEFYIQNIHPEDKHILLESIQWFIKNPTVPWKGTYRVKHKTGQWIWFHATGKVIKYNSDGSPHLIGGVMVQLDENSDRSGNLLQFLKSTDLNYSSNFHLQELLSQREMEIVRLVLKNTSTKDISTLMSISELTVKTHLKNIFNKLNINSRSELVKLFS